MEGTKPIEHVQTVVIGGGQAGLSVGFHLRRQGLPFVILDASARVGDSWRKRWDSLRLFTPARYDGLDGMPFPGDPFAFPTKDAMADYLEAYAAHFTLPMRSGVRVERLSRRGERYVVETADRTFEADQVVVAMASYQKPRIPAFATQLSPAIVQIHSLDYKSPSQLRNGDVLIVGAGNSGAEIAVDIARGHRIWISGRDTGAVPFRIDGRAARMFLLKILFRLVFHRVLTIRTPVGRKVRVKMHGRGGPLIRTKLSDLLALGIERVPKVVGVRDGSPMLEDGRVLEVANIIWCSGFSPGFSWIDLPIIDAHEDAAHDGGISSEEGLYFVGLHFLYALSSTMIHGVGRDAERIADVIAARVRAGGGANAAIRAA
jgi:putative flavoprotein involved in K+ transport